MTCETEQVVACLPSCVSCKRGVEAAVDAANASSGVQVSHYIKHAIVLGHCRSAIYPQRVLCRQDALDAVARRCDQLWECGSVVALSHGVEWSGVECPSKCPLLFTYRGGNCGHGASSGTLDQRCLLVLLRAHDSSVHFDKAIIGKEIQCPHGCHTRQGCTHALVQAAHLCQNTTHRVNRQAGHG